MSIEVSEKVEFDRNAAAKYLGFSVPTLDRLVRKKLIRTYKMGPGLRAPVRFNKEDLDKYIKRCVVEVAA